VLIVSFLSSAEGTSEGTVNTSFYTILFSENFVSLLCSLGAFAKLRKAIVSCVLSFRQSASPPVRRSAGPPVRRSAGPPVRRSAGPPARRSAGPQVRRPASPPARRSGRLE